MLGHPIATVLYEERLDASPPECLGEVAAICWAGFRLVRPPEVALENVVLGCRRLPQFRDARRATLSRQMRWHFQGARIEWRGSRLSVEGWRQLWREDAALRRHVLDHPAYSKWLEGLAGVVRSAPLVALAEEAGRHCYGQLGGDPQTLRAMHRFMEEGGI